ncbi:hypothetical protein CSB11_02530 [Candidatus Campbellbacteria bacterium]|nr:MAG: hypothetical protein CSB11_02530 [Candidatus Campbellbacteria bacterium]
MEKVKIFFIFKKQVEVLVRTSAGDIKLVFSKGRRLPKNKINKERWNLLSEKQKQDLEEVILNLSSQYERFYDFEGKNFSNLSEYYDNRKEVRQ